MSCQDKKCANYGVLAALLLMTIIIAITIFSSGNAAGSAMVGVRGELTSAGETIIENNQVIVFNTALDNQSSDIRYNGATGEFTVTKPGNYYISWWVSTDGTSASPFVMFSLQINGISYSDGISPIVTGQVSGCTFVTVESSSVITLVNTTSSDIVLANVPVQANILIVELR